jgi:hypothetical protein
MLKDGTSEVWPESVEKTFVDGTVIHYLFLLAILRVRRFRTAAILGISLGHVLAGPKQMAQPIPRRLLERGWNRTVQEASRESYPSTAEHVEGREGYVPSLLTHLRTRFIFVFADQNIN